MCKELLKQIKSLSYLFHNNDIFDKFEEDLSEILEDLELSVPLDDSLIKEILLSVRSSPKKEYLEILCLNQIRNYPV